MRSHHGDNLESSPCGSFCGPNLASAPRSAPRTPIFGRCCIPLCEADCGDEAALTTYSHGRLSRDLFHALTYEREMTRAGVEVFYALTAGDQTSPEGRLIRHMLQALDQFEVEKLGREVRRGQKQNTRQGYRNGGRAPYGYRLRHEAHPDPARAKAGRYEVPPGR